MELLVHIEWILLQFLLLEKFSLCKVNTPMCETCTLKHPQQHFCNSDFVIQGKILRRDNFTAPMTTATRITTATAAVPPVSPSTTVRHDKEGQLHVALPSQKHQSSVDALSRQPLQEGSVFTAPGSHFTEETDAGGTGGRDEAPISEVVRYRVFVSKIYKGSKWIRNRDVVDIDYIHNEFCGHHLIKETMLISGSMMNGHLVHHPCDWSILSTEISFDVHRQLAHVYHRHCRICTIETETSGLLGIQKVMTGSSGCVYKPSFYTGKGLPDCEGLYGACKKIQHGCSWSGTQRMRVCSRKRKTLFPSPSVLESQTSPTRHHKKVHYPEMKSRLSLIKTPLEEDADLRPSVAPAESVSENQEIPTLLLNNDEKDQEHLQTSDEELNHPLQQEAHADGRKQEVTPTLTTQREQSFLILPDRLKKVSPSYRTDLSIMHSDRSSKSFSAVSSSHPAIPQYAFDFPQPHVSSQDAADILEKITQQHLQKKEV